MGTCPSHRHHAGPPGRLRLTGYAGAQLLLAVPSLVLFVLAVVGGVLVIVWVGIVLLFVAVPALRWIADRHRAMAGHVLGTRCPRRTARRQPVTRAPWPG